jgi:Xaa-Pro aminopeptidase
MDFAPDFAYYTSDIGRMWPVNGHFSAEQRTLYSFIVKYHRALLEQIQPGRVPNQIMENVAVQMLKIIGETKFSNESHKQAALNALDFRGHLSHPVGMSVHDIGDYRNRPLVEGTVFSVDPMMWIEDEKTYIRCEDTVVVTKDGYENLTSSAPLDCDEIEKVMKDKGILQKLHDPIA